MKTINLHVKYAAEVFGKFGPTGEIREVIEAKILDYGDNALSGSGPVDEIVKFAKGFRIPIRVVPTKLGRTVGSADTVL